MGDPNVEKKDFYCTKMLQCKNECLVQLVLISPSLEANGQPSLELSSSPGAMNVLNGTFMLLKVYHKVAISSSGLSS